MMHFKDNFAVVTRGGSGIGRATALACGPVYNQFDAKTPKLETIMGITFVEGTVTGKKSKKASVKFHVDSGAQYSLVPEKDWKAIGLKPKRTMTFSLADGTEVEREISECHISLPQGDGHTPVILGRPGDEALL